MKIASGSVAVYCFMLIVTSAFINETWGFCGVNGTIGAPDCSVYEKVYPIYKTLENIVTNNTETLFLMRQAFFPAILAHFLEASERVNTVRIRVCWVPSKTRPLPACNSLDSNQTVTETQCKNFRWSRSPGLNMVAFDQLLEFDPLFTTWIYSRYVDHTYRRSFRLQFDMNPDVFPCTPTEDELTQATILFLTWSRAYAKAQRGIPTTWSQEDQGYIARWYSYYSAESYYKSKEIGENIRKVLIIVFILLNLVVLHICITITHGKKWDTIFGGETSSNIYRAVGIASTLFNLPYLYFTFYTYSKRFSMVECTVISHWNCRPSDDSSLYKDVLTSGSTKVLVIFTAIIVHLLVAIIVQIKTTTTTWCHKVVQTILLWNIFVFMQIWLGLIPIPACILLFTTPLQTISALCAAVLIVAATTASILYLLRYGTDCPRTPCNIFKCAAHFLWHFIFVGLTDTLVIGLGVLYFNMLPQGGSLSVRAVLISLLPTVLLSVGSWMVRKHKHKLFPRRENPQKQDKDKPACV